MTERELLVFPVLGAAEASCQRYNLMAHSDTSEIVRRSGRNKDKVRNRSYDLESKMSTVTIEEAQAKLPEIIDNLPAGEEVVIVRDGTAVAKLARTGAKQ